MRQPTRKLTSGQADVGTLAQLQGASVLGVVASIGTIFIGATELGVVALCLTGGLWALGNAEERREAEAKQAAELGQDVDIAPVSAAPPASTGAYAWRTLRPVVDRSVEIPPAVARAELRRFLKLSRNRRIRKELREEFRLALSTAEYWVHHRGERLTAGLWLNRARGLMVRRGLLP